MTPRRRTPGAKVCTLTPLSGHLSYRKQWTLGPRFSPSTQTERFIGTLMQPKSGAILYFSFSISKERAVVNSAFPTGRGEGTFYVCERMAHPQPSEDSFAQEHLFAPTEVCPNRVPGSGASPPIPHYPTIFIPHLSDACERLACSSQGEICLGPDVAKLPAANAHPESGSRGAGVQKCSSFLSVYQAQQKPLRGGSKTFIRTLTCYRAK